MCERRRHWLTVLALLGAAAVHGSCADATGPGGELIRLRLAPSFGAVAAAVTEEAAPLLVDNIRLRIDDPRGEVLLDTVVAWPAEQDTLRLRIAFRAPAGVTSFGYRLEARIGEDPLFAHEGTFDRSAFGDGASLAPTLEYVGPGAGAVDIAVVGPTSILAGDTARLSATVVDDAGEAIPDVAVEWSVLDAALAGIDAAGLLTAGNRLDLDVGVVVRVPYLGLADTVRLDVRPADVRVTGRTTLVALGDTTVLEAEALTTTGAVATGAVFSWATLDSAALALSPVGASAAVEALTTGTARVIAKAEDRADTLTLSLTQVVASVDLDPDTLSLVVGDTLSITAVAYDATGHTIPGTTFTWTALDPLTADLSQPGVAFGLAPGQGVLEAVAGDYGDSIVVDVAGYLLAVQHPDSISFVNQIFAYRGDAAGDSTLFLSRDTLTSVGRAHSRPAWSPDGRSVTYLRGDSLFVQPATAGAAPTLLVSGDSLPVADPVWSPDGTQIAFIKDTEIVTVAPADGTTDVMTDANGTLERTGKSSPTWSPDGKRMAFTVAGQVGNELWILDMATGVASAVTLKEVTNPSRPTWSPTDNLIAFEGTDTISNATNIWVADPDAPDTSLRRLSSGWIDGNPTWAPNGELIAFDYDYCGDGCRGMIAVVDPAATSPAPRAVLDLTGRSIFTSLFPAWGRPTPP